MTSDVKLDRAMIAALNRRGRSGRRIEKPPNDEFEQQLKLAGVTGWKREYMVHPLVEHKIRLWRYDFAWPELLIAVEINGGTFQAHSGHQGAGFRRDCIKGLAAAELGWSVITAMPEHVKTGRLLQVIERRLARCF